MSDPDRPDRDATADEIAEWMEEDFGNAVADGIENATDGNEQGTIEVEIRNFERGEVVGTIDTDGNLETESEALCEVSKRYLDEGVPMLVPTTYENEDGETVHADAEVLVKPGTRGSFGRSWTNFLVRSTAR